ncbi:hypothetical protein JCM4914_39450 [Streptomyces platensis subsp. malvinus]
MEQHGPADRQMQVAVPSNGLDLRQERCRDAVRGAGPLSGRPHGLDGEGGGVVAQAVRGG